MGTFWNSHSEGTDKQTILWFMGLVETLPGGSADTLPHKASKKKTKWVGPISILWGTTGSYMCGLA